MEGSSANQGESRRLRQLFDAPSEPVLIPGTAHALGALLIQEAGFPAVYMTGSGVAATQFGLPDVGVVTLTEMTGCAQRIVEAVSLPVLADADTGYGNQINTIRTVQQYERAGVQGIHIEDQVFPKKCGHMEGKALISAGQMQSKIRAALEARTNEDTLIIARTDAVTVYDLEEAIDRCKRYADSGADALFPCGISTVEGFVQLGAALQGGPPLMVDMTEWGVSPIIPAAELYEMGFPIVIYPSAMLRVAQAAMRTALAHIREHGTQEALLSQMMTRADLYDLVGLPEFQAWERQYADTRGE